MACNLREFNVARTYHKTGVIQKVAICMLITREVTGSVNRKSKLMFGLLVFGLFWNNWFSSVCGLFLIWLLVSSIFYDLP